MSAKPTINNDLHIYVVGSSKFQPRRDWSYCVPTTHWPKDDPVRGHRVAQAGGQGSSKGQTRLARFCLRRPADCTELLPDASAWAKELLAAGGAKEVCACVLDSVGSCRWKYLEGSVLQEDEREVERYFCRGDLVIGTGSQALGEVLSNWANQDHDIHYSRVSIDTINDYEGFAQHVLDVLRERVLDERVEVAFPASRQEDVEGLGTLDMVRDERDTFMDSEKLAAEADFLDTLPLAGFPKEEGDRRRAWAKIPRGVVVTLNISINSHGNV